MTLGLLEQQVEALADVGHGVGSTFLVEVAGVQRLKQEISHPAGCRPGP